MDLYIDIMPSFVVMAPFPMEVALVVFDVMVTAVSPILRI